MEKLIAIDTCLGVLRGRDCIFLDRVEQNDRGNLTFSGEINSVLTSKSKRNSQGEKWVPFTLAFHNVIACFSCELETYGNIMEASDLLGSDFDIIENSKWLESLPVRKDYHKDMYKHFRIYTYDIVYNIVADSYILEIDTPKQSCD
ncbi:MAG: hypothetical protein NC543_11745 [bacterium]|nr:hypothetical protein [bacterium]MCM1375941.1 hypothetical protein [Muribaculum sp.]